MRLGIVVNQPGVQEARAAGIAKGLADDVSAQVLVAPSPRNVLRAAAGWDVAYVIDPGSVGAPAAVAARARARPTFVEIGDPQRELYRAQSRSRLSVGVGGAIDAAVMCAADGIVFRGAQLADTLGPHAPWTFIPDGVDLDRFTPGDGSEIRKALGLPGDALVAGVVGSLNWSPARGTTYGLELVDALAHLRGEPVWALIVGGGDGLPRLQARAAELGVADRVVMTGHKPHAEIPSLLRAMDVCVSSQSDDAIGQGRTTAKLPEYLACDRFVLASPVGTAAQLLPGEMLLEPGEAGDPDHALRLSGRLAGLVSDQARLARSGATRDLAARHFGYDGIAEHLVAFVRSVIR